MQKLQSTKQGQKIFLSWSKYVFFSLQKCTCGQQFHFDFFADCKSYKNTKQVNEVCGIIFVHWYIQL